MGFFFSLIRNQRKVKQSVIIISSICFPDESRIWYMIKFKEEALMRKCENCFALSVFPFESARTSGIDQDPLRQKEQ